MPQPRKTAATAQPRSTGAAGPRRELVERLILDTAARLFEERGFAETSLQDVADEMGLTRSAIYYYVSNKEDILARLVEEFPTRDAAHLRAIRKSGLTPREALREMVRAHVAHIAERPGWLRMLDRNEYYLDGELAKTHAKAKRAVLSEIKAAIDAGADAGVFATPDTRTAALTVIGMANWVSWWYEPGHGTSSDGVAEQIAGMAVAALGPALDDADLAGVPTAEDLLNRMSSDIDRLRHMLGE